MNKFTSAERDGEFIFKVLSCGGILSVVCYLFLI